MSEPKHTPWRIVDTAKDYFEIVDNAGRRVMLCGQHEREHAAHIVRCVNAMPAMVLAIEDISRNLKLELAKPAGLAQLMSTVRIAEATARAALKAYKES